MVKVCRKYDRLMGWKQCWKWVRSEIN